MNVAKDLMHRATLAFFQPPEWLTVQEVQLPNSTRRVDLLAVNTGTLDVVCIETKVSRSDLLHELQSPEKSQPALEGCDRFYLLLGDPSLIRDGELPDGWGLLAWDDGRVQNLKAAKRRRPDEAMNRLLLARSLRISMERAGFLPGVIDRVAREQRAKGYRAGFSAARRGGGRTPRYDPARVDLTGDVEVDPETGRFCP